MSRELQDGAAATDYTETLALPFPRVPAPRIHALQDGGQIIGLYTADANAKGFARDSHFSENVWEHIICASML